MSEKLTDDDLSPLAAEYVLGTLEADERTRASVLLDVDPKFRDTVRVWERRLGELHLMVEPVVPEPRIWDRIRRKLGHAAADRIIATPEAAKAPEPGIMADDDAPAIATAEPAALPAPRADTKVERAADAGSTPEQKLSEIILDAERFSAAKLAEARAAEAKAAEAKASEVKPVESEPERVARDPDSRSSPPIVPSPALGPGPGLPPVPGLSAAPFDLPPPPPRQSEPVRDYDRLPDRYSDRSLPAVNERSRALVRGGRDHDDEVVVAVRSARRWRVCAMAAMAVAVLLVGLVAAWRLVPGRLPSALSPGVVLNLHGPGFVGRSSNLIQFDE
jgi:anti-sigma-K factor RskA